MSWSDFLFGFFLGVIPAFACRWILQRYCMYLAKLGNPKWLCSLIGLALTVFLAFSTVSLFLVLYVWVFGPEEAIWTHPSSLAGMAAVFALVWSIVTLRLYRYQAAYFVEYHYPQKIKIYGVPALIILVSFFIFSQLGLVDSVAEHLAHRLNFPQFCRVVSDKDNCYRGFYMDQLGQLKKVSPKICRGLEGAHATDCLIANHPHSPDATTCKVLKTRNRSSSPLYYWCLSYMPQLPETKDACRRAESAFRWVDVFFGDCVNAENISEEVSSNRSVAMHFLDFQENLKNPNYRNRFNIPDGLTPRFDFSKIVGLDPHLDKLDREGQSVLFYIHEVKDLEILLKRKPKLSHEDENGLTAPMHWITRERPERYIDLIEKIIEKGYDVDLVDGKKGRSLLSQYIVSLKGRPEEDRESDAVANFVKMLLKHGASPYSRDKQKKRPLDYATELKLKKVHETFKHK